MSNSSIINRLRQKLADYNENKTSMQEFNAFLLSSINALENKTDDIIDKARDFEYKFTCAQFEPEHDDKETNKLTDDFKNWLDLLNKNYH